MFNTLILFISGMISAAVLDYIWIGNLAGAFYKREIGSLARTVGGTFHPNVPAAIGVYILMAIGIIAFVLPRVGSGGGMLLKAFLFGALWGLILGGVYELTNYSMLAGWSAKLAALDMAWTALSGAISTVILYLISKAL